MAPFDWNKKTMKCAWQDPERGGAVIVERTPKEIVDNPNRHRHEDITKAICAAVSELMRIEEANFKRMEQLTEMMESARSKKADIE